jgi:RsiW-degrading membrane proteinase PrsW (M82 family)
METLTVSEGATADGDVVNAADLAGEGQDDAVLSEGEQLLRRMVTRVGPRVWLWVSFLSGSYLWGYPVALAFIAAIVDALFFFSLVWQVDCYEEEPWRLVEQTFLWGALPAVVLAVIGEVLLTGPARFLVGSARAGWLLVVLLGPLVEELCKGVVLVALFRRHRQEFDGMLDGLFYGALVGLGFSMTENVTYYLRAEPSYLQGIIFIRGLFLGMNHACYSACFGLGLGLACDATAPAMRRWAPVVGLVAGVGLHMANNLIWTADLVPLRLAALGLAVGAALLWMRLATFARKREARWIEEELAGEVEAGVMTAEEVEVISDVRARRTARARALEERTYGAAHTRVRMYALATELAFAKHKTKVDRTNVSAERIAALRRSLERVRARRLAAGWIG